MASQFHKWEFFSIKLWKKSSLFELQWDSFLRCGGSVKCTYLHGTFLTTLIYMNTVLCPNAHIECIFTYYLDSLWFQVSNWFGNKRIRYKKNIVKAQEEANAFATKKALQLSNNEDSNSELGSPFQPPPLGATSVHPPSMMLAPPPHPLHSGDWTGAYGNVTPPIHAPNLPPSAIAWTSTESHMLTRNLPHQSVDKKNE